MIIPLLAGIAAVVFLGCRGNSSEEAKSASSSDSDLPPVSGNSSNVFAQNRCDPQETPPHELPVKNVREEFCRLHRLLLGETCTVEGNGIRIDPNVRRPDLIQWMMRNPEPSRNYSFLMRDPSFQEDLSQLKGLNFYLVPGHPCQIDQLGDVRDLWRAYRLYESYRNNPRPEIQQAFQEGRLRCLLRRGGVPEMTYRADGSASLTDQDQILTEETLQRNLHVSRQLLVSACFSLSTPNSQP